MSEIKRLDVTTESSRRPDGGLREYGTMEECAEGEYVLCTDHIAALKEERKKVFDEAIKAYEDYVKSFDIDPPFISWEKLEEMKKKKEEK